MMPQTADNLTDAQSNLTQDRRPTVAVIPAAGWGTRLRPLSQFIPKEMLPVGAWPALWHIVHELQAAGIRKVVFVVSPEKREFIERCFGSETGDSEQHITFHYALQTEMRGLGDAVACAEPFVGNVPFLIALGDALFEEPEPGGLSRRLLETFSENQAAFTMAVQPVPVEKVSRYGIVQPIAPLAPDATVTALSDIVEKPAPEFAPSHLAAAARYVVSEEVFAVLRETPPGHKGEIQLTDALRGFLRANKPGFAMLLRPDEVRHDIGSLETYYRAFFAFALKDPEHSATLRHFLQKYSVPDIEHGAD